MFCLHFLGGSALQWSPIVERLTGAVRCVCLDLPGFGDAAREPGKSVEEMADGVVDAIRAERPASWYVAGHSMGAKVALAVARRAEDGTAGLADLRGLILVAGSPPSPEPMDDTKRAEMIAWIDSDPATRRSKARDYIRENVGVPLDPELENQAVEDVLRANPFAWKAWLTDGSRENWCRAIGVLRAPAIILSGTSDAALGSSAQVALMEPHLAHRTHVQLEGAGHLLPIERPDAVADQILALIGAAPPGPVMAPEITARYRSLIVSDRVNTRVRAALLERAMPDDPAYQPLALDPVELSILRATCDRVLPQAGWGRIDLAAQIDARLARGNGDGWRHANLPPDLPAYRLALRTLDECARATHKAPFVAIEPDLGDDILHATEEGQLSGCGFSASQMQLWFEDLRADVVRIYLAHPATLARLGYSGIGAGGDDAALLWGFRDIGIGECESWEPPAESAP